MTMTESHDDQLRPHTYDGIQEFDKRLPNWWLMTLSGTIIFSVAYWFWYHEWKFGGDPAADVVAEIKAAQEEALKGATVVDDDSLWKMSKEPQVVEAGKATFTTVCAACHRPDLMGQIGPNLVDKEWIHGGTPMEVMKTVTEGVPAKGMVPWAQVLGRQKIIEVTAFVMSHHQPGEEIIKVPGWTPIMPGAPAPAPAPPK
jgi:cytochrome c oxidase cbb3-type subunit 3